MSTEDEKKEYRPIVPIPTLKAVLDDRVPQEHWRSLMRDMAMDLLGGLWKHPPEYWTPSLNEKSKEDNE